MRRFSSLPAHAEACAERRRSDKAAIRSRIIEHDVNETTRTLIVGGGPAGMGLLLAAMRRGALGAFVADGLRLVEQGDCLGAGGLDAFAVSSDTIADRFVSCIDDFPDPHIAALAHSPEALALARCFGAGAPLSVAGRFLGRLGHAIGAAATTIDPGSILMGARALETRRVAGGWRTTVMDLRDRSVRGISSHNLVLATGADEDAVYARTATIAGQPLFPRHSEKTLMSGVVLNGDVQLIRRRFCPAGRPLRAVVVGNSHSAIAVARTLLDAAAFPDAQVTMVTRSPMRATFDSAEAAHAAGFYDFGPEDICASTGRVFPLAGFRLASRDLLLSILGLDGHPVESRVTVMRVGEAADAEIARRLDGADLVVTALGYKFRGLPLMSEDGASLRAHSPNFVDDRCRVLTSHGEPIPNLFAIGMATGFPMAGRFGEASFRGQANGLAAWQGDIGGDLVELLQGPGS